MCKPMAPAAALTSFSTDFAFPGLLGLMSTATRAAPGISSRSSSSLLAVSSVLRKLIPVRLPPGLGDAGDKTAFDRGLSDGEHDWGDRRGRCLRRQDRRNTSARADNGNPSAHQIGRQLRQSIRLNSQPSGKRSPRSPLRCIRSPSDPDETRADDPRNVSGDAGWRNPITGIDCCARAASGQRRRTAD